ncbi:MAG: NAD(+)/NADH kinase [Candidatus Omnitrophota bacterium]
MKIKNILLIYKKSYYRLHSMDERRGIFARSVTFQRKDIERFRQAHDAHTKTLRSVEKTLRALKLSYRKCYRGSRINYRSFDFVITVGGDGTFLEGARYANKQPMLGVNSDPERSIGRFCSANKQSFSKTISRILSNQLKPKSLHRIRISIRGLKPVNVLNDILISNDNPAAMSRYVLKIGQRKEFQRSSGLWISTAAGSSGAIKSAGGKVMKLQSKDGQYLPRELQICPNETLKLKGGIYRLKNPIVVTSLMRKGMIYVDGAHLRIPFPFNTKLIVSRSPDHISVF